MTSPEHNGQGQSVRTIERIVRTTLLLLTPVLVGVAALLVQRHSVLAWIGVGVVAVVLAGIVRLLSRMPLRDLLALAQRALLTGALVGAALIFVAIGLLPHLGLYRPVTVLSGSMRPTFKPGDLIIVRPEPLRDVRVGQVITYAVPVGGRQVETHRVIRIVKGGANPTVQTKGDANNWRDPWVARLDGATAWRLSVVIPYAGYAISAMRSRTMHTLSLVVVPGILALLLLAQLWGFPGNLRRLRESDARS